IGLLEYKVHAKVCLIGRKEKGEMVYYANLSTGNYNEKTARIYADHSLFTVNPALTSDLKRLFDGLLCKSFYTDYETLITSPLETRSRVYDLIDREIEVARSGRKGYMILKMNSLTDIPMIQKLYAASNAGVKI